MNLKSLHDSSSYPISLSHSSFYRFSYTPEYDSIAEKVGKDSLDLTTHFFIFMPRKQPKTLSHEERTKLLDELWTMIALLESREEVKNFFKDLLSETEALMLARRIQIAKLLLRGVGYDEIKEKLNTGYSTIAGVHRWLQSGSGGYEKVMPRLEKELERRETVKIKKTKERIPYTGEWLKRRYPLHFLLLNVIDWSASRPSKKLRKSTN